MILLIDIGNSRTKYVQVHSEQLSEIVQLTNDEFNQAYFTQFFNQASRIIVANVANAELTHNLALWCADRSVDCLQVRSEQQKFGLTSAYQEATTLGIDRWLAMLGAIHLYPKKNVLIIDAGTATTVDFVNNLGQHQGGWILAGIQALFNSILSHSTLVHAEDNTEAPSLAFGRNTSDNVNNACWAATLGLVDQSIHQAEQLGTIDHILLTGGNGEALTKMLTEHLALQLPSSHTKQSCMLGHSADKKTQFIEDLIFYGLKAYIP